MTRGAGITNEVQLASRFASLSKGRRMTAAWLLGRLGRRRAVPLLLRAIEIDPDAGVRGQAAASVAALGGRVALRGLLRIGKRPDVCGTVLRDVAYALSFIFDLGALDFLTAAFCNHQMDAELRAQCAEGIANLLEGTDRRTRMWRNAVVVLLPGLEDDDPEVRFWSAFALGTLRAKVALPALRTLARVDARTMSRMGWEIGEEAKDAICCILTGQWPEQDACTRRERS
ncbi:MAG: HEAT repeat domain-containing protein [Chloroflexota bacterium]